nr:MAG TPA: hypothetical protein [Caudoviricetes sp.]
MSKNTQASCRSTKLIHKLYKTRHKKVKKKGAEPPLSPLDIPIIFKAIHRYF